MRLSSSSSSAATASRWRRLGLGLAAIMSLLPGCDNRRIDRLEEGVATEADVRAQFGEPDAIWEEGSARTLEYVRQPQGQKNYMITIGPDGRMSALRQVLTPQNFQQVQPGMSAAELRRLLGRPARQVPYALKQETEWEWRWMQPPNQAMVFIATLDARGERVLRSGSVPDRSVEAN